MWLAISGFNPFALDPTPNRIRSESTYQRLGVSERLHPLFPLPLPLPLLPSSPTQLKKKTKKKKSHFVPSRPRPTPPVAAPSPPPPRRSPRSRAPPPQSPGERAPSRPLLLVPLPLRGSLWGFSILLRSLSPSPGVRECAKDSASGRSIIRRNFRQER